MRKKDIKITKDEKGNIKSIDIINKGVIKSITGEQGEKGPPGRDGEQGIQGLIGKEGKRGEKGEKGKDGISYSTKIEDQVYNNTQSILSSENKLLTKIKDYNTNLYKIDDSILLHIGDKSIHFDNLQQKTTVLEHIKKAHETIYVGGGAGVKGEKGDTGDAGTAGTTIHNLLLGLQGGQVDEYYHFTEDEHDLLVRLGEDSSGLTFDGLSVDSNLRTILHNILTDLQGGTTDEYYHFTEDQHSLLIRFNEDSAGLTFDGISLLDSLWQRTGTTLSPLNVSTIQYVGAQAAPGVAAPDALNVLGGAGIYDAGLGAPKGADIVFQAGAGSDGPSGAVGGDILFTGGDSGVDGVSSVAHGPTLLLQGGIPAGPSVGGSMFLDGGIDDNGIEDGYIYLCNTTGEVRIGWGRSTKTYFSNANSYIEYDGTIRIVDNTAIDFDSNVLYFGTNGHVNTNMWFLGDHNDGIYIWSEDEDYFQFNDDILMLTTERIYFTNTNSYIYNDGTGLEISDDARISFNNTNFINLGSGHNLFTDLQGGTTDEYYHFTEDQHSLLIRLGEDSAGLTFDGLPVGIDSLWTRLGGILSPIYSGDSIRVDGHIGVGTDAQTNAGYTYQEDVIDTTYGYSCSPTLITTTVSDKTIWGASFSCVMKGGNNPQTRLGGVLSKITLRAAYSGLVTDVIGFMVDYSLSDMNNFLNITNLYGLKNRSSSCTIYWSK